MPSTPSPMLLFAALLAGCSAQAPATQASGGDVPDGALPSLAGDAALPEGGTDRDDGAMPPVNDGGGGAALARGPTPPSNGASFPFPQNSESSHCSYPSDYDNADVT